MVPRLVPEISSKCAFCDEAVGAAVGAAVGIGDSRSLIGEWGLTNWTSYFLFKIEIYFDGW